MLGGPEQLSVRWERQLEEPAEFSIRPHLRKLSLLGILLFLLLCIFFGSFPGAAGEGYSACLWLCVSAIVWLLARDTASSSSSRVPNRGSLSWSDALKALVEDFWSGGRSGRVRYVILAELNLESWTVVSLPQQQQQQRYPSHPSPEVPRRSQSAAKTFSSSFSSLSTPPLSSPPIAKTPHKRQETRTPLGSAVGLKPAQAEEGILSRLQEASWGFWGPAQHSGLHVRGPLYLKDRKKVRRTSPPAIVPSIRPNHSLCTFLVCFFSCRP